MKPLLTFWLMPAMSLLITTTYSVRPYIFYFLKFPLDKPTPLIYTVQHLRFNKNKEKITYVSGSGNVSSIAALVVARP